MTTTVLAYFPSPGQGVWHLGPLPIRAYALCIIAGIIAALVIGDRRWVARGGERGVIYDIALWAVPFGLIGGRLYHLLTDWKTYFGPGGAGIGAALRIWEGGLGIWGAVALGGVGAWIACRRYGIPLPAFGDAVAPGLVLAQAIGRLGNYFNQELYGRETTVPWGMKVFYRRDAAGVVDVHSLDGVSTGQVAAVVHPTFLYELIWNLLVFVFLLWADRRFRLGHGRLFALYVAAYCVGRFWVELMRDDTATHIAGIRINVFTATFVFIGAVVYLLLAPKGREEPESLAGWERLEVDGDQPVEEWTGDLVAAAKGSGVLAAATVAGEHEAEDSAAVGDIDDPHRAVFVDSDSDADTTVTEAIAVEETTSEDGVEAEASDVPDAAAMTVVYTSDETVGEVSEQTEHEVSDADDATTVVYVSDEVTDTQVEHVENEVHEVADTVVDDHEVADTADADTDAVGSDATVVMYQAPQESDTVVVYGSPDAEVEYEAVSENVEADVHEVYEVYGGDAPDDTEAVQRVAE